MSQQIGPKFEYCNENDSVCALRRGRGNTVYTIVPDGATIRRFVITRFKPVVQQRSSYASFNFSIQALINLNFVSLLISLQLYTSMDWIVIIMYYCVYSELKGFSTRRISG